MENLRTKNKKLEKELNDVYIESEKRINIIK